MKRYFKLDRIQNERYNDSFDLKDINRTSGSGYVYFVQASSGGLVKIGKTSVYRPRERLKGLQCGSPIKLVFRALLINGSKYERELHKHFNNYRVRGEWFKPKVLARLGNWLEDNFNIYNPDRYDGKNISFHLLDGIIVPKRGQNRYIANGRLESQQSIKDTKRMRKY